jgi:DNA primase
MWRVSDEPIIALDGDKAGVRAARRLIDLALPLLQAGKSLRFVVFPQGQDPDDLIREEGPGAMQRLLDSAQPMVELLWEREVYGKNFDSPERKAALDKILREKLRLIKDSSIRGHYGQALKSMRWDLFRTKYRTQNSQPRGRQLISPQASTRSSSLAISNENSHLLRQSVILASLLKAPGAIAPVETQLADLYFLKLEHRQIQNFLLEYSGALDQLWQSAEKIFGVQPLEALLNLPHVRIAPSVRNSADIELVVFCLLQEFAQISAFDAHGREIAEAVQDHSDLDDEGMTWRLNESAKHVQKTLQGVQDDKTQYNTAANGLRVKLDEQNKLENLLGEINFLKPNTK